MHVTNIRTKMIKVIMDKAQKNVCFRIILRNIVLLLRKLRYLLLNFGTSTDEKMIMFQSFMGQGYSCSPKALYRQIIDMDEFRDFKFVWAFKEPESSLSPELEKSVKVKYLSKEYYTYLWKAKFWISNTRIPDHVPKKKDQIYLQCWHGTPLKKLGCDIEQSKNALNTKKEMDAKYLHDAVKYDYFISPSSFASEKFRTAFKLDNIHKKDIILEEGAPRNDYLRKWSDRDAALIKKKLSIPDGKKVILYAPTWRDNQYQSGMGYTYELQVNFDRWRTMLSDDYIILFRAHYHIANQFDFKEYKDFVFNVSDLDDVNECYIISDVLITDYSSVFFDYAILCRPIIFFMYDLEVYKDEMRGFYLDIDELPGPVFKEEEKLLSYLSEPTVRNSDYSLEIFNRRFNELNRADTSLRIIREVFKGSFSNDS